jgi:hypothetical protein
MKPAFTSYVSLSIITVWVLWWSNLPDRPELAFVDSFVASVSATLAIGFLESRGLR